MFAKYSRLSAKLYTTTGKPKRFFCCVYTLVLVTLTGCSGDESQMVNPAVTLPVPSPIREIRAFDTTALSLEISVNDDLPEIHTGQQSSDFWRVSVDVPVSQENTIKFVWVENYEQERLVLAQQLTTVQASTEAIAINLDNDFQTSGAGFDFDSDGVSNLAERQNDTNPLVSDSGQFVVNEPEMVSITADCFTMGSPLSEEGRITWEIEHDVCVDNYQIGKFEITFEQYDQFALATNRQRPDDRGWGRGSLPVIHVNWFDANAYASWLSEQTNNRYRLPTEAEWEYAAREHDNRRRC